jgi:hypothetical protein
LPPNDQAYHEAMVEIVRTTLGEEAYVTAWDEGRALPVETAIAAALEE